MIKLDSKITGTQLNKKIKEVIDITKKDFIPGKSDARYVRLESIEVIPDEVVVEFEACSDFEGYWDVKNPIWAVDVMFIQTGRIFQIVCENYDFNLEKISNKIARLIKKEF